MGQPKRVVLVGCGGMGHNHAREYTDMVETDLVGVCDIELENAKKFASEYSVEGVYSDAITMLDELSPDICVVATRPVNHAEPTLQALERGVHVLCEKSLAPSLMECDAVIEMAEKNGCTLAVNTQRRTDPYHRHARKLIAEGKVGTVKSIHGHSKNYPAAFNMQNIGSHLFDSMRMLLGDISWVSAHITHEGQDIAPKHLELDVRGTGIGAGTDAYLTLFFEGGAHGTVEMYEWQGTFGWEIVGTEGLMSLRGMQDKLMFREDTDDFPGSISDVSWQELEVPMTQREKSAIARRRYAVDMMMMDVIDAIDNGRAPQSAGEHGRAAVEIVAAAYQSQLTGSRVMLPMTLREHPLQKWADAV